MRTLLNGLLLATGTLTALRVPMPSHVDRRVHAAAMVLAPLSVLPLGLLAAAMAWLGTSIALPTMATSLLVLGGLALATRALHWDGLADTADGLTASYSAARSLEVMRTGDVGPAGAVTIVLLLALQTVGVAELVTHELGWICVGLLLCASRTVLAIACARGVPAARRDGLGAAHVGVVPLPLAAVAALLGVALTCAAVTLLGGPWWSGVGISAAAALVVGALLLRCVRRLGGVTGDVLGACVEVTLATLVVGASAL